VQVNFHQPSVQGSVQADSPDGRNDVKLFTHTKLSGKLRTQPMQDWERTWHSSADCKLTQFNQCKCLLEKKASCLLLASSSAYTALKNTATKRQMSMQRQVWSGHRQHVMITILYFLLKGIAAGVGSRGSCRGCTSRLICTGVQLETENARGVGHQSIYWTQGRHGH